MKVLNSIKISEYETDPDIFKKWRTVGEPLPDYFWQKFQNFPKHETLFQLLTKIRKELHNLYGSKRDLGSSLGDSRFTSLPQMLERGMVSCGALTAIVGTTLRQFNIPVKFVHGKLEGSGPNDRHAWLKIYNPHQKKWITIDPGTKEFNILPTARQWKIYFDWHEFEKDYDKGKS